MPQLLFRHGARIDETISRAITARQLAQEHERRKRWQNLITSARLFKTE